MIQGKLFGDDTHEASEEASLRFCVLGSGSTGNATLVQAVSASAKFGLLIDCGVGLVTLKKRLSAMGASLDDIDAVFITHEHTDHVGALPALLALRGGPDSKLPVICSAGTWQGILRGAAPRRPARGKRSDPLPAEFAIQEALQLADWRQAASGATLDAGAGLRVHPFTVPHDSAEALQLAVSLRNAKGTRRLAYATDLGHDCPRVAANLQGAHAMLLESNHDPQMLANGGYPPFLKRRVASDHGHLSNAQSASLLRSAWHSGLHTVVAGHLSLQNNRPELAETALLPSIQSPTKLICCPAAGWPEWIEV